MGSTVRNDLDAKTTINCSDCGQSSTGETAASMGALIYGAGEKTTPVNADYFAIADSADSNILKKLSWANVKATLKTYFDITISP